MVVLGMRFIVLQRGHELSIGSVSVGVAVVRIFMVVLMKVRFHMMVRFVVWFDSRRIVVLGVAMTSTLRRSLALVDRARFLDFTAFMQLIVDAIPVAAEGRAPAMPPSQDLKTQKVLAEDCTDEDAILF
jgi:hypothetical protein